MEDSTKALIFLTLIVYIIHLVFNAIAGKGDSKLFPNSVAKVSQTFDLFITPVPATFSIWGLIFTLQLCWMIYTIVTVFRSSPTSDILSDGFFIAFIFNIVMITIWLFTWARKEALISFVVLLTGQVLIGVAIGFSFYDLKVFLDDNPMFCFGNSDVWTQRILVQNGLLFYGTWTMIATLLNLASVLVYYIGLSQKAASITSLSLLLVLSVIWFILENTALSAFAPYTFSAYLVLMIGLTGTTINIFNVDKFLRSVTMVLLILCGIFFVARVILISTQSKDPCSINADKLNRTIASL